MYTAAEILRKASPRLSGRAEPKAYPRPLGMRTSEPKRRRVEAPGAPDPEFGRPDAQATETRSEFAIPRVPPLWERAPAREAKAYPGEARVSPDRRAASAPAREEAAKPAPPVIPPQMNPSYVPPPVRSPEIYKGLMAKHDRVNQRHLRP